jgi:FtsH-binding integral membrane protein
MSYALDHPIAEHAPPSARALFIRRTYGHLAGAVLAFVAVETVLQNLPNVAEITAAMIGGRISWLLVLAAYMVVCFLAERLAESDASPGVQYLGLGLFVVAEAVIFVPLLFIARNFYPDAIPTAGILTLAIFAGLTLTVFVTRSDFSFLRPILCVGSMLALGFIVAGLIFHFSIGLFFCFAMVALLSGYILYYTSNILHHYRTDKHVAASLALFASIGTLFWYILQIVMAASSRD